MEAQRSAGTLGAHVEVVDERADQGCGAIIRRGLVGAQALNGHEGGLRANQARDFLAQVGQGLDGLNAPAGHQLRQKLVGGLGLLLDDAGEAKDHCRGDAVVALLQLAAQQLQTGGQGRARIVGDRGGHVPPAWSGAGRPGRTVAPCPIQTSCPRTTRFDRRH